MQVKKKHLELDMGKQTGSNFFFPPSTCPPLYPFSSNHILLVNGLTFLSWATGVQGVPPCQRAGTATQELLYRAFETCSEAIWWDECWPWASAQWFQFWKGVHQGCILSPCFFNFYADCIMQNARLGEAQAGIKISRRNINNLRYADDTTLMAESEEELKSFLIKVKEQSKKKKKKLA